MDHSSCNSNLNLRWHVYLHGTACIAIDSSIVRSLHDVECPTARINHNLTKILWLEGFYGCCAIWGNAGRGADIAWKIYVIAPSTIKKRIVAFWWLVGEDKAAVAYKSNLLKAGTHVKFCAALRLELGNRRSHVPKASRPSPELVFLCCKIDLNKLKLLRFWIADVDEGVDLTIS